MARQTLTPRVVELTFSFDADGFEWAAGQYVLVRVPSVSSDGFAFSIANAYDPGHPELCLAVGEGPSSELLSRAPIGLDVELEGPFGSLGWHDAPGALLVGAGTGVTPLHALVQEAVSRDQRNVPVLLLAGSRSEEELLWEEELTALAATSEYFDYRPILSQPGAECSGRRGWVQAHLSDAVLALPSGFAAYLCGSHAMVEQCRAELERLGVSESRVRYESY